MGRHDTQAGRERKRNVGAALTSGPVPWQRGRRCVGSVPVLPHFHHGRRVLSRGGRDRMARTATPYDDLPARAFWRRAVAVPGLDGLSDLWTSRWDLPADARLATYGSCFAQHIGRALCARGMGWIDAEPAPPRTPAEVAAAFGYGIFSARTANIYTTAHLRLLLAMAAGDVPVDRPEIWEDGGQFRDSLRPAIEPGGFASRDEALASRASMIRAFRRSVEAADAFVFTLGLTEGWQNRITGQPYAICPGPLGGTFDPALHVFANARSTAIRADFEAATGLLRRLNPQVKLLLTVSPVPLTATASGDHVLVATTRSKATLRTVAAELAADDPGVDYFPSYEIITGAPARMGFFAGNLRSVTAGGVETVMRHFFAGLRLTAPARHGAAPSPLRAIRAARRALRAEALACEEAMLDAP